MQKMTVKEWREIGEKLYGPDPKGWKFRCPSCGGVQTIQDFEAIEGFTGDASRFAYFSCIGRMLPKCSQAFDDGPPPCNYTTGGLINISPLYVIDEEGKERPAFAFAGMPPSRPGIDPAPPPSVRPAALVDKIDEGKPGGAPG